MQKPIQECISWSCTELDCGTLNLIAVIVYCAVSIKLVLVARLDFEILFVCSAGSLGA